MEIIYSSKNQEFHKMQELPSAKGGSSGYLLISLVKSGFDLYVCFSNLNRDKVYIEKTTTLNPNKFLCFEDLNHIESQEEFNKIYKFLIDKRILDG